MLKQKFLNHTRTCLVIIVASLISITACAEKSDSASSKKNDKAIIANITTDFGTIELKLLPNLAPKHVENFVTLAKSGFYDGTIFHRVIPGFMIQGGDPFTKNKESTARYGQGGPDHRVKAEFTNTPHKRGILSMARSQNINSAGSQFFIVVNDSPFLDNKYTVFGEVTKGMDVADKIVSQARNRRDLPNKRIEMKVSILD